MKKRDGEGNQSEVGVRLPDNMSLAQLFIWHNMLHEPLVADDIKLHLKYIQVLCLCLTNFDRLSPTFCFAVQEMQSAWILLPQYKGF